MKIPFLVAVAVGVCLMAVSEVTFAATETIRIQGGLGDGFIITAPYPATWSDQINAEIGRSVDYSGQNLVVMSGSFYTPGGYLGMVRSFLGFDTSVIPDNATITKAELHLYTVDKLDQYNDDFGYIGLYKSFHELDNSLLEEDIDQCGESIFSPVALAPHADITNLNINEYHTYELNSVGLNWIKKDTFTKLCVREGHDVENKETVKNINNGVWQESRVRFASANSALEHTAPYLEITYSIDDQKEKEYPLYTQIESPYPSLLETAQWADEQYANGSASDSCGTTIGECGCAITSLVMAARNAGIEEDILGDDVNPGNMNEYLESVSGYTSYGALRWLAAQAYFGEFTSEGFIASRFATPVDRPSAGESVMSFIDAKLGEGNVALLGFKNGHFVWLPEKTADSYFVNDPWWYNTLTANDDVGEKIKDYNNSFSDARALAISDTPIAFSGTDIEVHLQGTAELLFTRATGERVGFENGTVVVDLEHASYGDTPLISLEGASGSEGKHLLVYQAGNVFTIEVVGTGTGEFSMEFFTISATGEVTTFEFTGATLPGITSTFSFNLATGEVEELPISYEQFLTILGRELSGYSEQQQKFFTKWADKIYSNMEEKTVTQAIQSIEVYKKLLIAKKVDSPFLTGALDLLQAGL